MWGCERTSPHRTVGGVVGTSIPRSILLEGLEAGLNSRRSLGLMNQVLRRKHTTLALAASVRMSDAELVAYVSRFSFEASPGAGIWVRVE